MNQGIVKVLVACLSLTGLVNIAHAGTSTASPKATATLAATCTISAQNLSFGNLVLPLSAQSASTSMNVLCNNKASYTVGLAYGGIYGQGNSPQTEEIGYFGAGTAGQYDVFAYNEQTGAVTSLGSNVSISTVNSLVSGATKATSSTYEPMPGICNTYSQCTAFYTKQVPGTAFGYGVMTGVASGDKVAYSIQVPGNSSEVWNAGESSYSATGTGISQSIPVVGKLVPAQSSGNYPTPDMYMDTVTASVSF